MTFRTWLRTSSYDGRSLTTQIVTCDLNLKKCTQQVVFNAIPCILFRQFPSSLDEDQVVSITTK